GDNALNSGEILKVYKGQYGVESGFAFLKDPIVVNWYSSLFKRHFRLFFDSPNFLIRCALCTKIFPYFLFFSLE
ncbi:hypothetical protein DRN98_07300, partial [Methanosarcinales archaeon]